MVVLPNVRPFLLREGVCFPHSTSTPVGSAHVPVDDGEAGQALVEFVVCLPVLLLLVFGIATFGVAFNNYLILENATNVAARQLAVSRGNTDPCSTAATAVIAATPTLNSNNITYAYVLNGVSSSGTTCPSAAANMVQGGTAKLTLTYPCNLSSYKWAYASCSLTASTAEMIQ